jgi:putative toxin-antitoxin system antitoxin component (TIGR02293 family)
VRDKAKFEVIGQMDHLQMFHEVARALTQPLEIEDILHIITDQMAQFFGPQQWSMLMVDEKAQEFYYAIAVGEDSGSLKGLRVPIGGGFAGTVAKSGTPLVVPDVALDPNWAAFTRANPDLNIRSIACVPVRSGDKVLGVIQLLNSKLDLMSEYSISFLRTLCDYAAIAIDNATRMKLTITDDVTGLVNARHFYTLLDEHRAVKRGDKVRVSESLQAIAHGASEGSHGVPKAWAEQLFRRLSNVGGEVVGKLRMQLIPDSTWKRAGEVLGPSASETVFRLANALTVAERIWRSEAEAIRFLLRPHVELGQAAPYALLNTESGGRRVENLLAALEYGFPV